MSARGLALLEPADHQLVQLQNAILEARDSRALLCRALAERHACAVISITLRIPGPVKDAPRRRKAVRKTLAALRDAVADEGALREAHFRVSAAGPEALLAVSADPYMLKAMCIALEDLLPWGPVMDIDVQVMKGGTVTPLHREAIGAAPRCCLACHNPAFVCIAERRHSLSDILSAAERYLLQVDADPALSAAAPVREACDA